MLYLCKIFIVLQNKTHQQNNSFTYFNFRKFLSILFKFVLSTDLKSSLFYFLQINKYKVKKYKQFTICSLHCFWAIWLPSIVNIISIWNNDHNNKEILTIFLLVVSVRDHSHSYDLKYTKYHRKRNFSLAPKCDILWLTFRDQVHSQMTYLNEQMWFGARVYFKTFNGIHILFKSPCNHDGNNESELIYGKKIKTAMPFIFIDLQYFYHPVRRASA